MPGSPDTQPAPDLPDERRLALVVSTASYQDAALRQLRAPAHDAIDLGEVLADPEVGGFAVTSVTDATAQEVRIAVGDFLADRRPDDIVLVYLSCHGLVDLRRRLYFAARDTTKSRLAATGVEAQWLLEQLEDCRARRQVLVLDCCFSGAFAIGTKGTEDLGLGERFHGQGRGRVVLTASRDSEYSFEGEPVQGQAVPGSVFTSALVDGIRSGAADLDKDGFISVDDAYGYAFDAVRTSNAEQTPQRWFYGAEGAILLARSPAGVTITPAEVPDGIASSLDSSYPSVRIGAVEALAEWLDDDDPARVVAARRTLTRVVESDRPEVAARARALLESHAALGETAPSGALPPQRGDGQGPGPATSDVAANTRDRRSHAVPRVWYASAALLVVVGVVIATVFWLRQPSNPGGGALGEQSRGSYTASGPWRLEIHPSNNGCSVTVTQDGGDLTWRQEDVWVDKAFQMPYTGTFTWAVNDPGCAIVPRATPGQVELPFTKSAWTGDTDAFHVPGTFTAEVRSWETSEQDECELVLKDPSDGTMVDIRTATRARPSVILDPGERSEVYLAEMSCDVRVSE